MVRCPAVDLRGARRLVGLCCGAAGHEEELGEVAALLTSELVTNALVHGGGGASLSVGVAATGVHVEVVDDRPGALAPAAWSASATGGRGLALVEALATAWGVRPAGSGKVVWFDLVSSPAPAGPDGETPAAPARSAS